VVVLADDRQEVTGRKAAPLLMKVSKFFRKSVANKKVPALFTTPSLTLTNNEVHRLTARGFSPSLHHPLAAMHVYILYPLLALMSTFLTRKCLSQTLE